MSKKDSVSFLQQAKLWFHRLVMRIQSGYRHASSCGSDMPQCQQQFWGNDYESLSHTVKLGTMLWNLLSVLNPYLRSSGGPAITCLKWPGNQLHWGTFWKKMSGFHGSLFCTILERDNLFWLSIWIFQLRGAILKRVILDVIGVFVCVYMCVVSLCLSGIY